MEATGGVITGRGILCAFSKRYSLFFLFFESRCIDGGQGGLYGTGRRGRAFAMIAFISFVFRGQERGVD